MFKQSLSKNNRPKGFKPKYILQICLLLAVCFWLIYQVKRSHDKKVEFDSEDDKVVEKLRSEAEILRFGRKDLPRITETATDVDEHLLEEEEKEAAEEEDDKSEDKEDDGIDESDLEKAEAEPERDDEINKSEKVVEKTEAAGAREKDVDEENERDENEGGVVDNQPENEENDDGEDEERSEIKEHEGSTNEDHVEDDVKLEERDNDGDSTNIHETREGQYKADDASSEVGHDNQTIRPEIGNATDRNEIWSEVGPENETVTSNKEDVGLYPREDELNSNITSTNATVTEFNDPGNHSATFENDTIEGGSGYKSEQAMDDETHLQMVADSNNSENVNTNVVESLISDDTMLVEGRKLEDSGAFNSDENANVIPHDPIDASDSTLMWDEKDSRMDLETLPEITTEARNTDDTMAE